MQKNCKRGTQDQDPTKQIEFVQCTPSQSFSCVRFMFRTFKLFAWFRHTYEVKKMYLLLFYLQYPPPVCLVCCIPRVQTIIAAFLSLVSPTYLRALPPILGQNLHVTACVTFQFSRSHHPFTWLQTLLWLDFATP